MHDDPYLTSHRTRTNVRRETPNTPTEPDHNSATLAEVIPLNPPPPPITTEEP